MFILYSKHPNGQRIQHFQVGVVANSKLGAFKQLSREKAVVINKRTTSFRKY